MHARLSHFTYKCPFVGWEKTGIVAIRYGTLQVIMIRSSFHSTLDERYVKYVKYVCSYESIGKFAYGVLVFSILMMFSKTMD